MGYVFISYSTRNQRFVDEMKAFLQENSIKTWMAPGDIPPGSDYPSTIVQAIEECSCVVLMLSRESQESFWVRSEINMARTYSKDIIPVRIDDAAVNGVFQFFVGLAQIIDVQSIDGETPECQRLLNSVLALTGTISAQAVNQQGVLTREQSEQEDVVVENDHLIHEEHAVVDEQMNNGEAVDDQPKETEDSLPDEQTAPESCEEETSQCFMPEALPELTEPMVYRRHKRIAAGWKHTLGIDANGVVVVAGQPDTPKHRVFRWRGIMAISAGEKHSVALKRNGTVVATGDNSDGRCDVDQWEEIIGISAGRLHTVGLKKDGTVVATGNNKYGQCNVEQWRDVVFVVAGMYDTLGLQKNGRVLIAGRHEKKWKAIKEWEDIVAVDVEDFAVGLTKDGRVKVAVQGMWDSLFYNLKDVLSWENVCDVEVGSWGRVVALMKDGRVKASGWNVFHQCEVQEWSDIIEIASGVSHTVGLRSDGAVVAVGYNKTHGCEVNTWNLLL